MNELDRMMRIMSGPKRIKRRAWDKYQVMTIWSPTSEMYETAIVIDKSHMVFVVDIANSKLAALWKNWRTFRALKKGEKNFGVISSSIDTKINDMMVIHAPRMMNIDNPKPSKSKDKVVDIKSKI